MIDTSHAIETPEGVLLDLRPAGVMVRALAWSIDMAIRIVLYFALAMVYAVLGRVGMGLWLISLFLIEWFYPVLFEVLARGQTPGKMATGIRVLGDDGTPVDWSRSFVRSLVMFVDLMPFPYGAGLASMLIQRDGKRLGDLVAGTLVVYADRRPSRRTKFNNHQMFDIDQVPVGVALTLDEQRAIMAFAERVQTLTTERSVELADLLEPLTGTKGTEGLTRLCSLAASYAGQAAPGEAQS